LPNLEDKMNKPRRSTDLNADDLICLISLREKKLNTISSHIKRNHFADNTQVLKDASQLDNTLIKLKQLKERITCLACDGA